MAESARQIAPLWRAGLLCRCPRCGTAPLFAGYLTVRETCRDCSLDLRAQDAADGPAVFVILILGFIVVGLALAVEILYQPPYWLHVVLWLPLTLAGALLMLRPFKATLIALHYKHGLLEQRPSGER